MSNAEALQAARDLLADMPVPDGYYSASNEVISKLDAALAQPAASGEPVAVITHEGTLWINTNPHRLPIGTRLYTAQPAPARVPLTDAQIDDCMPVGMAPYVTLCGPPEIRRFARAIEAVHGITADAPSGRDWSLLEATQESLREHMSEIAGLRAALAAERERCAVLVEDTQRQWPGEGLDGYLLAAEIRGPNVRAKRETPHDQA